MDEKLKNYAFIDGNNLNFGMKGLGWKLDYARFRCYLKEKYKVEIAYIFWAISPSINPCIRRCKNTAMF